MAARPPFLFQQNDIMEATDADRQNRIPSESPRRRSRWNHGRALIMLIVVMTGIPGDSHDGKADGSGRSDAKSAENSLANQQAYEEGLQQATRAGLVPELLFRLGHWWESAGGNTASSETEELSNGNREDGSRATPGTSPSRLTGRRSAGAPVGLLGAGSTARSDEISTLRAGLLETFTAIDANRGTRVFADTLPLVGNHLATEPVPTTPAQHYLTVANTINTATFIQILDPALIGLGAINPAVADDGTGARFKVQFSINEPMTAGMFLKIQASTDLGANDPWVTVASKTGSASWVGPANVTISPPSAGKVTITVSALQPVSIVARQFYRFRLSSL